MSKKITIAIVVLFLCMLLWTILAGGKQNEELLKEEAYQSESYEYEIEAVDTIVAFDNEGKTYASNIQISSGEILYAAQRKFEVPDNFDVSYQIYTEGKHRYAGNINYKDGEYQSEGVRTSDVQNDGKSSYQVEGQSEEGIQKDGEGPKENRREIEKQEKQIIALAKDSFVKMKMLSERKLVTVKNDYYVKEVVIKNQDTIKEIIILNKEQRTGEKTVIKITIER